MGWMSEIGDHLTASEIVKGSSGWTLALGRMLPTPDKTVAILSAPGDEPDGTEGGDHDMLAFRVQARSGQYGYEDARDRIGRVYRELDNVTILGYIYVFAIDTIRLAGYDTNERPVLEVTFQGMREH